MTQYQIVEIYRHLATRYGDRFGVPPSLILAVIQVESSGSFFAISNANAYGLMQITEPALKDYNDGNKDHITMYEVLYSPELNIKVGTWYLRWLIDRIPVTRDVLRAYNVGIGRVRSGDTTGGANYADMVLTKQQGAEKLLADFESA